MSSPTLEEMTFWREMVQAAWLAADKPTVDNIAKLRKLGEKARNVRAPGFKIPGRLLLFRDFNAAARSPGADGLAELLRLADQVQGAIDEAAPKAREDF